MDAPFYKIQWKSQSWTILEIRYSRPARRKSSFFLLSNMFIRQILAFHDQSESDPEGEPLTLLSLEERVLQTWAAKHIFS